MNMHKNTSQRMCPTSNNVLNQYKTSKGRVAAECMSVYISHSYALLELWPCLARLWCAGFHINPPAEPHRCGKIDHFFAFKATPYPNSTSILTQ